MKIDHAQRQFDTKPNHREAISLNRLLQVEVWEDLLCVAENEFFGHFFSGERLTQIIPVIVVYLEIAAVRIVVLEYRIEI